MSINISKRTVGVNFTESGIAEVVVWAPNADNVSVIIKDGAPEAPDDIVPLKKQLYGYWKTHTEKIKPGTAYLISVDDEAFPDPASLAQPWDVHAPSMAVDLKAYKWKDAGWKNLPLDSYVLYELHTGCFSSEHNFDGIRNKLDYLVDLGITAIELMPVGQFPGNRNWGYDGVFPFAVQASYGGAEKLQQLIDACHKKGIAVVLDVIYNHLGPEGNYLPKFGPYFTDKYKTPWGPALNYDDAWCDGVREYIIDNVLMWFRDFHVDALRLDAVHAIKDFSPVHLLKSIKEKVNELTATTGKPYYLIAELDLNNPIYINPLTSGGYGGDAQWIDEFHHALRVSSGQKQEGYYSDFNGVVHLAKSYNDAYVYDGQFSEHRKKFFGVKTNNPGQQFVVFSQNHDHVGNRMLGERTSQLVSFEMCKLMAAAVMTAPFLPFLFMGEEWAETNPFLFFISHTDEALAAMVNKGRAEEFASFKWEGTPPDPRLEDTFKRSMLQWHLLNEPPHSAMLNYYKQLISLRKTQPALRSTDRNGTRAEANEANNTLLLFRSVDAQQITCIMNFSKQQQPLPIDISNRTLLLDSASIQWNGPNHETAPSSPTFIQPESILIYTSN